MPTSNPYPIFDQKIELPIASLPLQLLLSSPKALIFTNLNVTSILTTQQPSLAHKFATSAAYYQPVCHCRSLLSDFYTANLSFRLFFSLKNRLVKPYG